MAPTPFKIGNRLIGPDAPAFIVAEIGINHNGDMALAKEQIDAAAEAGADSVKFQNYRVDDFVSDRSLEITYRSQGKVRETKELLIDTPNHRRKHRLLKRLYSVSIFVVG
jgi:sialic acid synthase SpsE